MFGRITEVGSGATARKERAVWAAASRPARSVGILGHDSRPYSVAGARVRAGRPPQGWRCIPPRGFLVQEIQDDGGVNRQHTNAKIERVVDRVWIIIG